MAKFTIETTSESVEKLYSSMNEKLGAVKKKTGRQSLTLAEKILFSHLDSLDQEFERGKSFVLLRPDRVIMQDATAQMALLQFMQSGRKQTAGPATVHCDHLILARQGSEKDLSTARTTNQEVYDFLASVCNKYGLGFWKPGAGIIHQVALENYAFPGGLMIGTDSHTPNGGGLGMAAIGVGGSDAADVMAGLAWEVKFPKLIGVKLTGELKGWTSPKDIILYLCGLLTTKGGTDQIIEYFGPGTTSISCTGKGTIANMGAELGATTSVFPYDKRMADYLKITNRESLAKLADKYSEHLRADADVEKNPDKYFDKVVEIDLSKLEPHVVGPHSPDVARPISKFKKEIEEKGYPAKLSAALIGSCTNSSYEDISRAAHIAKQALDKGLKMPQPFLVSPGSEQIHLTIKRDGQMKILNELGATVLANACGPCIGQWKRDDLKEGEKNSIISSFNRNFRGRNDSNPETLSFLSSPDIVMALGIAGTLAFDPVRDELNSPQGKFKFEAPRGEDLPAKGYASGDLGYAAPSENPDKVEVKVSPTSDRLQLLKPFAKWDGKDFLDLPLLVKAKGKCTTDHISPAGPWLKYRGHLDNISNNMFLGAVNAFSGEAGKTTDLISGQTSQPIPQVARNYKAKGMRWIVVGDENYGEGSSREHAAMSPRFLGAAAIIVKSFARIHETNLKKQGVLALTFVNPADYEKISEKDKLSVKGLGGFAPGKNLELEITHPDGKRDSVSVKHSYSAEQIAWFKAGSALNLLSQN
ncbi:MAG: aconitate hydratase [Oligoflexia bacterium]|nr:aconitate hydratase [Oligoflexia bacterium]